MTSWDASAHALDHHGTVGALAAALPETTTDGFREIELDRDALAATLAANLARVGLVLVPVTGGALLADLTGQVDTHLKEQAAASWFGREEDR